MTWFSHLPAHRPFAQPVTLPDVLTPEECVRFREQSTSVPPHPTSGCTPMCRVPPEGEFTWFFERMHEAMWQVNAQWGFDVTHTDYAEVMRYEPGADGYRPHCDSTGDDMGGRKITLVTMLSDPSEYEGGGLSLYTSDPPWRPPHDQGTVVAFPSWTLHRVDPPTTGVRWSAATFVHGPMFR